MIYTKPKIVQLKKKKLIRRSPEPPFTDLKSFNASAIILSFFGLEFEVCELMMKLCHNSRSYFIGHRTILEGFVVNTKNSITFGPGPELWTRFTKLDWNR